jgi:hypothetical protein
MHVNNSDVGFRMSQPAAPLMQKAALNSSYTVERRNRRRTQSNFIKQTKGGVKSGFGFGEMITYCGRCRLDS